MTMGLQDLEARIAAGERLTRADVERIRASVDLIGVGVLGDIAIGQLLLMTKSFRVH